MNYKWITLAVGWRINCRGWARLEQGEGDRPKNCGLNKGDSVGDGVKQLDSKYSLKVQLTEDFIIINNIYLAASASR